MERPGDSIHTIDTLRARGGIPDVWNKLQALHVSRNENISHARGASQKGKYYILDPTPSSYLISGVIVDIGCISYISIIPIHFLVDSILHIWSMSHMSNITKHFLLDSISHTVYHSSATYPNTLLRRVYPIMGVCHISATSRSNFSLDSIITCLECITSLKYCEALSSRQHIGSVLYQQHTEALSRRYHIKY